MNNSQTVARDPREFAGLSDLATSLILIASVSCASFFVTIRFCHGRSESAAKAVALASIISGGVYFIFVWNQPFLARLVPFSGLIVLGNWFPIFSAILAGSVWSSSASLIRRSVPATSLAVVSTFALVTPLLGDRPVCGDSWKDDICLQTTPYTCSAASAATLLHTHGIDATEREMAELCLTHRGTNWMGLFRGLSKKTDGTPWKVQVFDVSPGDNAQLPETAAILVARLPDDLQNHELRETCGWIPGQAHSVTYLGNLNDDVLIVGDPAFGRELWRRSDLNLLWTGRGLRLVPRISSGRWNQLAATRNK